MATRKRITKRSTKRSIKRSTKGGVHHRSHRRTMKVNRQSVSAPRLSHMGIVAHRRKIPFQMREVPVQEVMGTIKYGHINPRDENAYMRRLTARAFLNHKKRFREKMIKEDIRHEREVARLMEEARRKNEENAEVNAEVAEMIHEANVANLETAIQGL